MRYASTADRLFQKQSKTEEAVARAATLAPLAEAATPFFREQEFKLLEELIAAKTDDARREIAGGLKALRDLKTWLTAQNALGEQARRELEKGK